MRTYRRVEVWLHPLTVALEGDEWSASHPAALTPGKKTTVPTG